MAKKGLYFVEYFGSELRETNQGDSRKTGKTCLVNNECTKVGKFQRGLDQRQKEYDRDIGNVKLHLAFNGDHLSNEENYDLEKKVLKELKEYRMRNPYTNRLTENLKGIGFKELTNVIDQLTNQGRIVN